MPRDLNTIVNAVTLLLLLVAGIPFAIGTYRKNKGAADTEVIASQERRIGVLEGEKSQQALEIEHLKGAVKEIGRKLDLAKSEALEYKALIIGEKVPEAMNAMVAGYAAQIIDRVSVTENNVLSAILAFGTDLHEATLALTSAAEAIGQSGEAA